MCEEEEEEEACVAIVLAFAYVDGKKRKWKNRFRMKEWFEKWAKFTHHNLTDKMMERSPATISRWITSHSWSFWKWLHLTYKNQTQS
jgi:hypothetical protein